MASSDDAHLLASGPPEDIAAVYPDYKTNLKKIGPGPDVIALLVIGLSASESDTSSTASGQ